MSADQTVQVVSRLTGGRRRFFLLLSVLVMGLLVHVGLFYFASVPIGPGPARAESKPWISWEGAQVPLGGPVLREQALLLDAEPLFVPTVWNTASALDNIASLRDEAELFAPFPVRLGSGAAIWQPRRTLESEQLLDRRLERGELAPLRLLGRAEATAESSITVRLPVVEVVSVSTGRAVVPASPLQTEGARIPQGVWSPLEFLLVVDPAGGGGWPLRLNSSGFPEWDSAVAQALARHRPLTFLPTGYFRVTVGP